MYCERSVAIKIINNPFKFEPRKDFLKSTKNPYIRNRLRYKFSNCAFSNELWLNKRFLHAISYSLTAYNAFIFWKMAPYFKRNLNFGHGLGKLRFWGRKKGLVKCQFVLSIILVKSLRINSCEQTKYWEKERWLGFLSDRKFRSKGYSFYNEKLAFVRV